MRYPAIITKEGKKTLASFPDCPGCQTELIRGKISPFRRRTRSQDGSRHISSWVVSLHNRPQGSRGEGCSGSKCLPGLQSNF